MDVDNLHFIHSNVEIFLLEKILLTSFIFLDSLNMFTNQRSLSGPFAIPTGPDPKVLRHDLIKTLQKSPLREVCEKASTKMLTF